jgi:hypothetical protein
MGDRGWDPSRLVNHADHPLLAVRVLGAVESRRGGARDADFERRGSRRGGVGWGTKGELKPPARGVQGEEKTPCTTLCRPG